MVVGQHQPVPVFGGADQNDPEGRLVGEVADRGAFGGAQPLDLLIDIDAVGVQFDIPPGRRGIGRDDLHRLLELVAEPGHQVGMPGDHGVHRLAQPVRVERAADADIELHRIQIVAARRGVGVKQQPLLQRGQRQHIGDLVLLL